MTPSIRVAGLYPHWISAARHKQFFRLSIGGRYGDHGAYQLPEEKSPASSCRLFGRLPRRRQSAQGKEVPSLLASVLLRTSASKNGIDVHKWGTLSFPPKDWRLTIQTSFSHFFPPFYSLPYPPRLPHHL